MAPMLITILDRVTFGFMVAILLTLAWLVVAVLRMGKLLVGARSLLQTRRVWRGGLLLTAGTCLLAVAIALEVAEDAPSYEMPVDDGLETLALVLIWAAVPHLLPVVRPRPILGGVRSGGPSPRGPRESRGGGPPASRPAIPGPAE